MNRSVKSLAAAIVACVVLGDAVAHQGHHDHHQDHDIDHNHGRLGDASASPLASGDMLDGDYHHRNATLHGHHRHGRCGAQIHTEHEMAEVNRKLREHRERRDLGGKKSVSVASFTGLQGSVPITTKAPTQPHTERPTARLTQRPTPLPTPRPTLRHTAWYYTQRPTVRPTPCPVNIAILTDPTTSLIESAPLDDASTSLISSSDATVTELEENIDAMPSDTLVDIRVHVHIIEPSPNAILDHTFEKVSDLAVASQMAVLNQAFAGLETVTCVGAGDRGLPEAAGKAAVTPFRFVLDSLTRYENTEWYLVELSPADTTNLIEQNMKIKTRKGDCETLNVWIKYTGLDDYGWVHSPWNCLKDRSVMDQDGIVLSSSSVPGGSKKSFNQGDTLVHEVGHWLGLYHTFHGGCQGEGDFVADTPPQKDPGWSCLDYGKKSCRTGGTAVDAITNFMDYTQDCCMFQFTDGQTKRMIDTWEVYRAAAI